MFQEMNLQYDLDELEKIEVSNWKNSWHKLASILWDILYRAQGRLEIKTGVFQLWSVRIGKIDFWCSFPVITLLTCLIFKRYDYHSTKKLIESVISESQKKSVHVKKNSEICFSDHNKNIFFSFYFFLVTKTIALAIWFGNIESSGKLIWNLFAEHRNSELYKSVISSVSDCLQKHAKEYFLFM